MYDAAMRKEIRQGTSPDARLTYETCAGCRTTDCRDEIIEGAHYVTQLPKVEA